MRESEPERAPLRGAERSTSNVQRSTFNEDSAAAAPRRFDLEERLLEFAARIIRLVDALPNTRAANHVGGQLLRSGTSPLPNHGEAQAAESRNDFIHKLRICLKELRESRRWLKLIKRAPLVEKPDKIDPLIAETEELIRIFDRSIRTARENNRSASTVREESPESDPWTLEVERWTLNVEPAAGAPPLPDTAAAPPAAAPAAPPAAPPAAAPAAAPAAPPAAPPAAAPAAGAPPPEETP